MAAENNELIRTESLSKVYSTGEVEVAALDRVDLTVHAGEFTAIAGPSGSGKTTLLNLLSGLDSPTSGRVVLAGKPLTDMSGGELSDYRRDHIGFIFQAYNLIPVLSARENIEYIMLLQGVPDEERKDRVREILYQVGMEGM